MRVFDSISAGETECLTTAAQVEREVGRVRISSQIERRTKTWILACIFIVLLIVIVLLGVYVGSSVDVSSKSWQAELESCGSIDADENIISVLSIFEPKEYNVSLHLEKDVFRVYTGQPGFRGQSKVTVRMHQTVSCLLLHADNLTIETIDVSWEDHSKTLICADRNACEREFVLLHKQAEPAQSFEQNLHSLHWSGHVFQKDTTYVISFTYTGVVSDKVTSLGLHRSKHAVCENKVAVCEESMAVGSQLERNGARKVFPCLDTPLAKSIFHIQIEAPYDEAPAVLSNGKQISMLNSSDGASRVVVFESTPIMSTYLIAFVAGKFNMVSSRSIEGVHDGMYEVRGWSTLGKENLMTPAVVAGVKSLEFYHAMFQMKQPIKVFDFVAFPGRKGAMENWGLLIFDELRVLERSGTFWHYQTLSVVCHEVAHQWLGNIITAKNWTQLFLNEGFAVTVEYYCLHEVDERFSTEVLRFLGITPGGSKQHVHDGIVQQNLECTDPLLCGPLVPKSDLDLDDSLVYSRGAIALYSLLNQHNLFNVLHDLLEKYKFEAIDILDVIDQHRKSTPNFESNLSSIHTFSYDIDSSFGILAPLLFFPTGLLGVVTNNVDSGNTVIQAKAFCAWNSSHINADKIDEADRERLRTCQSIVGEVEYRHLDFVPLCGSDSTSDTECDSSLTTIESNIDLHSMRIKYQMDEVREMIDALFQENETCVFENFKKKTIFLANLLLDHYAIALLEDSNALSIALYVLDSIGANIQDFPRGLAEYLLLAPAYQVLATLEDFARKSSYVKDDKCTLRVQSIFYALQPKYDDTWSMKGENPEDEYLRHLAYPDLVLRILLYPVQYKALGHNKDTNRKLSAGWVVSLCSQSASTTLVRKQYLVSTVRDDGQDGPQISVDLYTTIYGVLAANLCEQSASTSDIASALSRCYLREQDYSEATRCLHSIIYVQEYAIMKETLQSILGSEPDPKSEIVDVYADVAHTIVLLSQRGGQDSLDRSISVLQALGDRVACIALKDIRTPRVASDIMKMSKLVDVFAHDCNPSLITSWRGRLAQASASEEYIVNVLCSASGKA